MIMDKCLHYMRKCMFITIRYILLTSHSANIPNTSDRSSLWSPYANIPIFLIPIPTIQFNERPETHNQDSDSECDAVVHNATDNVGYYADAIVGENNGEHDPNSGNDDDDDEDDDEYSDDDEDDDYGTDPEDYRLIMSELTHEDREKEHGRYYIGMSFLCNSEGIYLMNSTISARTFLAYSYSRVHAYVRNTSCYYVRQNTQIEIMQLCIHADGVYEVVLKTYWLRIVQRRWKNIYKERQRILRLRSSIQNQEYFRRNGKYMEGSRHFPSIRGALCA